MHENHSSRPHPEYVVLDIGEHLGALIVYTDAGLHGTEIEISPEGADAMRSHKDVLERGLGERTAFTAVFDRLPEGTYTLWSSGVAMARGVKVEGGAVAELDWNAVVLAAPASASGDGRVHAPDRGSAHAPIRTAAA